MTEFLCFRLHGPLAAWGDIAVGDIRPSLPHPTRSALLGLVGGALGVRREDDAAWRALDDALAVACLTEAPGALLVDFHTAQGPHEKDLRARAKETAKDALPVPRSASRREELAFPRAKLDTQLSTRQYRVDAVWRVALSVRSGQASPWPLVAMRDALRRPAFVPYLGRRSCTLDIPMEPQLVTAADPLAALERAQFASDEILAPLLLAGTGGARSLQWEGEWAALTPAESARRRDRIVTRSRWQFGDRTEHRLMLDTREGANDVSEQG